MKRPAYESSLPEGYVQVRHINAKDVKFGLIFNSIAIATLAVVMLIAAVPLWLQDGVSYALGIWESMWLLLAFSAALILYIVLHELVHGAVYKALTHQKLTFGMSWSCAFCGVPNVYTYRRTALLALVAPLTVFTLILVPLTVVLYAVHPLYYLASAFILGMHLGGCSGDIYVTWLLLFKYRSPRILMRDTGPEQFIFLPKD